MAAKSQWQFWIDTGGTFTDCLAVDPGGHKRRLKVLSTGAVRAQVLKVVPGHQVWLSGLPPVSDGFYRSFSLSTASTGKVASVVEWDSFRGVATLNGAGELRLTVGDVVDLSADEEAPVLAMRILTGTPPPGQLPSCELRLATTRGTNALLEGRTAETAFFVTQGFSDLLRIGDQRRLDLFALNPSKPPALHGSSIEVCERLAADGTVVEPLDLESLRSPALELIDRGVTIAAVSLLHSYRNPAHEQAVATFLRELGFSHVSVSSDLAAFIKAVPRAATAVVDAILSPIMNRYLDGVGEVVGGQRFEVMTSAGGLVQRGEYRAKDSLLSGPAGGVVGAAAVARRAGLSRIIGFDMGGTSTDVARFEGDFDYQFEHTVGSARVFAPSLRLETVAAGGGSICRFDGSALVVGPESAAADPGPACYGGGGPLTLTDVNLMLGRLSPDLFGLPVFPEAAEARFDEVAAAIHRSTGHVPRREELLNGFLAIADERMADAIRRISVREGYDPADYTLVAFGGAGGLHACPVAERLGMGRVLFPSDSGLLSALGLREAVRERFAERQVMRSLPEVQSNLERLLDELAEEACGCLAAEGVTRERTVARRAEVELRFVGQDSLLTVEAAPLDAMRDRFLTAYRQRYGYVPQESALEVVTIRVVVSETPGLFNAETFPDVEGRRSSPSAETGMIARADLHLGDVIQGPSVIQDSFSTLMISSGWAGIVGTGGSIRLEHESRGESAVAAIHPEVVELELFTSRFLSLVEEMGVLLQRCATSVNVKERLDFSCALLDADGELVANAPHIPVHLGALGMCVRAVREAIVMEPGDVVVTNHPAFGGSHLPDVTLVAPVHDSAGELIGYVANRAHHAEMGGVRPGSMPPDARSLAEEGAILSPMRLVRGAEARWDALRTVLAGGAYPSRAVNENIADLHAQLASVRRGAEALMSLASQAGLAKVHRFMHLLKMRSAEALGEALRPLGGARLDALDRMDDGTPIAVSCVATGDGLTVDFNGSGAVHPGNLNATPAIVHSAVIYVLRLLAGKDLPLNEGLLRDVRIVIPEGILSPRFPDRADQCPAVVGGNVETSQRIVDVLLQALGLAACSQGTMNNVTFGNERFSCYETIGGGAGASADEAGCSAVHVHMTNTAITDPEVMEVRMPVRLERFAVRTGSGGVGRHPGGDGIERRIRFLEPAELSLLSQRRVQGPPGAEGGESGKPGRQWIERGDGRMELLPFAAGARMGQGDVLVIQTPGGGGWGVASR